MKASSATEKEIFKSKLLMLERKRLLKAISAREKEIVESSSAREKKINC